MAASVFWERLLPGPERPLWQRRQCSPNLSPLDQAVAIIGAGFFGTVVDSLLGAVFERRGWLDNDLVNLLSTASAVGAAWVLG